MDLAQAIPLTGNQAFTSDPSNTNNLKHILSSAPPGAVQLILQEARPDTAPPTTTGPSPAVIDEAARKLHDSIKVIGVIGCPKHPQRAFCNCQAAIASLGPSSIQHSKVNMFTRGWDSHLLHTEHAFDYTGDKASHDAFVAKEKVTPKKFAKNFLAQNDMVKQLFAPSSHVNGTVVAMVNYWTTRNAQWKAKYGTREAAKENWDRDTYDNSKVRTVPRLGEKFRDMRRTGGMIMSYETDYGSPEHSCSITLMPYGDLGTGEFLMLIVEHKGCHAPCAVMDPYERKLVADIIAEQAKGLGHDSGKAGVKAFDDGDSLRAYVELKTGVNEG